MADRDQDLPFATVVVPCRNEAPFIEAMVRSLVVSAYPRDRLEIIFVDGMSTDGTREALAKACAEHPFIRVLDNPKLVTPAALNLGIRAARGEFIVRMDAHAEFPPDYIGLCIALLRSDPKIGSAGGRVVNLAGRNGPWAEAAAFVRSQRLGVGNVAYTVGTRPGAVDTVAFGSFRRRILEEVGMFDERLTRIQDSELHARLRRHGYKVAFDPAIVAYYRNRSNLKAFARRALKTSEWLVYAQMLHPYMWTPRRLIPTAFLVYLTLLALTALSRPRWLPAAALPLALYVLLVAAVSLRREAAAAGRLRVAATFVCHHLAYGAGMFLGLANVALGRWRSLLGRPIR